MANLGVLLDMAFKSAGIVAADDRQLSAQQQRQLPQKQPPYALSAKGELLFVKDRRWTPYEYEENYQVYLQKLAEHLGAQAQNKAQVSAPASERINSMAFADDRCGGAGPHEEEQHIAR